MKSPLLLETIRIEDGKALHLGYHNQRFAKARKELFGIDEPFDLATIVEPPHSGVYRCRVVYGEGIESVEYIPYHVTKIETIGIAQSSINYSHKYADRTQLNQLRESCSACDEVLLIRDGLVTDTTIANVAFLKDGRWITPQKPLLGGTTRQRLIDEGFLSSENIPYEAIPHFDGFALMNAMVGFMPIMPKWANRVSKP